MSRQAKIVSDSLVLGARQVLVMALVTVQTLFAARFLGPAGFGTYAIISVLAMIAAVGNPGFLGAASRELPHFRAGGDKERERAIFNHAAIGELAFAALWTLVIAAVALIQNKRELQSLLLLVALSIVPAKLVSLYQLKAYADKAFEFQSRVSLIVAAVTALLVVSLVWRLHLYVVLFAPVVGNIAGVMLCRTRYRLDLQWRKVQTREMSRLAKIGLPMAGLAVVSGSNGLQRWIERTLLGTYLGTTALGIFAFFAWVSLAVHALLGGLIQALQPHLYELVSEDLDQAAIERLLLKPMWTFSVVSLLLIGFIMAVLPDIIAAFLPEYAPGVAIMYVMLASMFVACLSWIPGLLMSAVRFNAQLDYLIAWIVAIAVSTAAAIWLLETGWGIMSLAVAFLVSQLVVLALTIRRLWSYLFSQSRTFTTLAGELLLPLLNVTLALLGIVLLSGALEPVPLGMAGHALGAVSKAMIFALLSLPTAILLERKTKFYSEHIRPLLARSTAL